MKTVSVIVIGLAYIVGILVAKIAGLIAMLALGFAAFSYFADKPVQPALDIAWLSGWTWGISCIVVIVGAAFLAWAKYSSD